MKNLYNIAFIVLIIGGLNWGLYGLFSIDIIESLLGGIPMIARLVYVAVGVATLYVLIEYSKTSCNCSSCDCSSKKSCNSSSCNCSSCDCSTQKCCDHTYGSSEKKEKKEVSKNETV
jgi:uncharacterized membrane protein YuzA (DUF378 family)